MKIKVSVFVVVLLMAFAISASADLIGSDTFSYSGTITANQQWASTSTQLIWKVSQDTGMPFHYEYQFIVPKTDTKSISHFIIEVSNNFEDKDIINFDGYINDDQTKKLIEVVGFYSPADGNGNSNPNMPSPMRGIKFEKADENDNSDIWSMTVWFDSWRTPVLGDFYAKDGKTDQIAVTAWNTGFTSSPDSDLTESNHLLRPDTVVPEPSSIMVLGMSLLSLGGMWKLKKK